MSMSVGTDVCSATAHRGRGLENNIDAGAVPSEVGRGSGGYEAVIRDRHGNVKQRVQCHNVRTLEGYEHLLGVALGGAPQVTSWFVGLKGPGTPTENDTHESHPAWAELTDYDEVTRVLWSPSAVSAAVGGGRQIDNFASSATFTASGPMTVSGAFLTSVAGKHGFGIVTTDDFTGTNGSPPNPALWSVTSSGTTAADIQANRLHLSTSDFANVSVASVTDVTDGRIDLDVEIPAAAEPGEFYFEVAIRGDATNRYYLRLFRETGTDEPKADLRKLVGDVELPLDTNPATLTLSNSILHYNVRFEVEGTVVRAAVRDFALGAIPEGSWDLEGVDNDLTAAGSYGPVLFGAGGDRDVFVDNFVFSQKEQGVITSVADFPSPIVLNAGNTINVRTRLIGRAA